MRRVAGDGGESGTRIIGGRGMAATREYAVETAIRSDPLEIEVAQLSQKLAPGRAAQVTSIPIQECAKALASALHLIGCSVETASNTDHLASSYRSSCCVYTHQISRRQVTKQIWHVAHRSKSKRLVSFKAPLRPYQTLDCIANN